MIRGEGPPRAANSAPCGGSAATAASVGEHLPADRWRAIDGFLGAAYAIHTIAALLTMSDGHDLGRAIGDAFQERGAPRAVAQPVGHLLQLPAMRGVARIRR